MAEGGEVADQIYQLYLTEQPWPDEFVAGLMLPDLIASAERGFVLDGIPRKASESAVLIDLLAKNGVKLDLVINLFSDYETSMQRIMMRMENEDKRPEKLDHYKVRLDMYWKGIAVMRETLGSIAKFVDIDATRAAPAEILDNLFSHLNNL
jgi:adenylate kinase